MDLRRPPRSTSGGVEPKIRQVGFVTPDVSGTSELPASSAPQPSSVRFDAGRVRALRGRHEVPGPFRWGARNDAPLRLLPYLTRVKLGNPPQSFDVLIDTGSSIPWISCQASNGLGTRFFNPGLSSSLLTCSDQICQIMAQVDYAKCNSTTNRCDYDLPYGEGDASSIASGYYLSDVLHLDGLSSPIVFGCTNSWSGQLTRGGFDGVFGLAPFEMSFTSQLYSHGISGKSFTLCMHSPSGGGVLALGEAVEPGLIYTPLRSSQEFYQLNLESIAVNGKTLPINTSVFRQSPEAYTFVDSGTTLAYLADGAYDPFVNAITAAIPPSAHPLFRNDEEICFVTSTSIDLSFPSVELYFAGGAKMMLQPHNYLRYVDQSTYCIAWLRNMGTQVTILGDIVLVDKLIVHDMENMRLGWMNYDCSRPFNVTTSPGKKIASSGKALHIISTTTGVALILIFYIILHA